MAVNRPRESHRSAAAKKELDSGDIGCSVALVPANIDVL